MKEPKDFMLAPYGNKVYIRLDEIPQMSGHVALAPGHATPTRIGEILACGPDCKWAKPGDRVIMGVFPGQPLYLWEYDIKDERWRVLMETEILGKVTKEG